MHVRKSTMFFINHLVGVSSIEFQWSQKDDGDVKMPFLLK